MPPGAIPFPFGDCRICKDKATGIHYGVATCEGCKGFFKRSLPKGDKYKCFFGGQCVITPQNRNRCKSCRYRQCLSLGMSFEAVKMGRIPKVEKQKALNASRGMDGEWKEVKNNESPDSGIDEENQRQMFWSQGRPEGLSQSQGYPPERPSQSKGYPPERPSKSQGYPPERPSQSKGYLPERSSQSQEYPPERPPQSQGYPPERPLQAKGCPQERLPQSQGYPSYSPAFNQESFPRPVATSTKCPSLNLDIVPGSNLDPAYTISPGSGINESQCENPNMAYEHSMPNFPQERSNMNLLAEAALLPCGQVSGGEDSTSADSNSSRNRSMYSSNVIKVLFNQVVEMTSTKKVPEVMEKLAQKCPGNDSVDLLKSLSCENYFDNDKKPLEGTDPITSHHSTWPSQNEHQSLEDFDKIAYEETDGFSCHGQPSRHFQDVHQGVHVGDIHSDVIPFYKEETETDLFQVNQFQNDYQVPHHQNKNNCSESFYSKLHNPADTREEIWQSKDEKLDNEIERLSPSEVTHTEKGEGVWHSRDSILEDLEKGTDQLFESVILDLQNALDKHHEQLRESSAFAKAFKEKGVPIVKDEITEQSIKETWNQLFKSVAQANDRIIGFCGDIPGFVKLNVDDQKILMKRAYYDIWMLTASEFFMEGESYLRLPSGKFYSRQWMEYVIGDENVKLLFDFAESFNRLKLSELEISAIAAIELTSPGHDIELKDHLAIQKLNSLYLDLLVHIITKRNPDNSSRILVDIFRLLPKLADINKMQQDLVANFSKDKPPS